MVLYIDQFHGPYRIQVIYFCYATKKTLDLTPQLFFLALCQIQIQWKLDLRKPDLKKIVATAVFLVH